MSDVNQPVRYVRRHGSPAPRSHMTDLLQGALELCRRRGIPARGGVANTIWCALPPFGRLLIARAGGPGESVDVTEGSRLATEFRNANAIVLPFYDLPMLSIALDNWCEKETRR